MRAGRGIAVASLFAAVAALGSSTAGAGPEQAGAPRLALGGTERCDLGSERPWRCGHVSVPLFRNGPPRGTINVGYAVRAAANRRLPVKGTIVAVEGGPGYTATSGPFANSMLAVLAPLMGRYNLVLVDARGTGTSGVLNCRGLQRGTVPEPVGVARCARRLGPRFAAYTTAATVGDFEAVRRKLEAGQIFLYGDSYGTLQGQAYAARFGSKLRGLILDSAYPADDPYYRTLYPAGRRAMRIACRRAPTCSGDGWAAYADVVRHFHRVGRPTGNLLGFLLGAGTLAPRSYLNLDEASRMFLRGERRRLNRLIAPGYPGQGDVRDFSYGLEIAVECNDYPLMWNERSAYRQRLRQLRRAVTKLPRGHFAPFSRSEYLLSEEAHLVTCLRWPKPPKGGTEAPVPRGFRASREYPTLILAGELDNITSVEEARQVAERFPRSQLFIDPNRGHASSLYYPFVSPAVDVIRRFIRRH
jgi:pimeloyl-ACP methyl ester carboxylesterase